jgi:hypothetical protein
MKTSVLLCLLAVFSLLSLVYSDPARDLSTSQKIKSTLTSQLAQSLLGQWYVDAIATDSFEGAPLLGVNSALRYRFGVVANPNNKQVTIFRPSRDGPSSGFDGSIKALRAQGQRIADRYNQKELTTGKPLRLEDKFSQDMVNAKFLRKEYFLSFPQIFGDNFYIFLWLFEVPEGSAEPTYLIDVDGVIRKSNTDYNAPDPDSSGNRLLYIEQRRRLGLTFQD